MIRNFTQKHRIFFIIISFAVIAHIGAFFTLKVLTVKFPHALHSSFPIAGGGDDSIDYATLGSNMFQYGRLSLHEGINSPPETYRTPAYPFFIASIIALTGGIDSVPFFQIILMALSAFLIYLIALSVSPDYKNIGLIAVGLFAFDPSTFFCTQFITTEFLYIFLFLLSVYFLVQKTYSRKIAFTIAGVSYGISALVRPAGLYMIIPIGVWFLGCLFTSENRKEILKNAGIFCLTSLLIISPWVLRNGAKVGVHSFSSLSAYNMLNFNLPLYLYYKYEYKKPVEDIRNELHQKIGNISDEEQRKLENSGLIKETVWKTLKPDIFNYIIFHVSKSANFFFSPSLKLDVGFIKGFWEGQPNKLWRPEISLVNSALDGRLYDVLKWFYGNLPYLPESLFLLAMFVFGLYWYWNVIWKSNPAKLIFLMIFFLALLTSPISNPRYRFPVLPLMHIAGLAGVSLAIKKNKNNTGANSI